MNPGLSGVTAESRLVGSPQAQQMALSISVRATESSPRAEFVFPT